ncbi:UNVERIFIED_CONTAM: hypothetical protein K2H54_015676 [Gekko kuhli]
MHLQQSPHEKKKRRSHSHTKSKARSHSPSISPGKQSALKNATHSASVSPVESRGSSQERSRGVSLEKDGQISSAIVSSVQSKITQVRFKMLLLQALALFSNRTVQSPIGDTSSTDQPGVAVLLEEFHQWLRKGSCLDGASCLSPSSQGSLEIS